MGVQDFSDCHIACIARAVVVYVYGKLYGVTHFGNAFTSPYHGSFCDCHINQVECSDVGNISLVVSRVGIVFSAVYAYEIGEVACGFDLGDYCHHFG